jgi:hypothetical protein
MNNENTSPTALLGEDAAQAISLGQFRRLAQCSSGKVESWVACTVTHRTLVAGQNVFHLISPEATDGGDELQVTFPEPVQWRLQARHAAQPEWIGALVGSTVILRLRTRPGEERTAICNISPAWIDDVIRAEHREHRRELADLGAFECQHQLPEPATVQRICVIADEQDPIWPSVERRLAAMGVSYWVEAAAYDGNAGRLAVIGSLRRASARAASGEIDLVLMLCGGPLRDGVYALHDDDAASAICTMGAPVVVGMRRPAQGCSLIHEASFAASETSEDAMSIVEGLIQRANEAAAKQYLTEQSEQRWQDERAERD